MEKVISFINLTPHTLNVVTDEGIISIPSSGTVARCAQQNQKCGTVGGINLFRTTFGEVEGLPEAATDTIYVVSGLVRAAVPERSDVASPGALIRDDNGNVIGCAGLSIN